MWWKLFLQSDSFDAFDKFRFLSRKFYFWNDSLITSCFSANDTYWNMTLDIKRKRLISNIEWLFERYWELWFWYNSNVSIQVFTRSHKWFSLIRNDVHIRSVFTITLLNWNRLHCVVRNFLHSFFDWIYNRTRGQSMDCVHDYLDWINANAFRCSSGGPCCQSFFLYFA